MMLQLEWVGDSHRKYILGMQLSLFEFNLFVFWERLFVS